MALLLVVLLAQVVSPVHCSQFSTTSTDLKKTLLMNYDREVRPNELTTVSLTMVLISLNNLDTATQSMSLTALWFTNWLDDRLSWNETSYNNTGSLTFGSKETWVPPLVITNEVDDVGLLGREKVPLRAFSGGQMLWIPPSSLQTSCEINVSNFPFDLQMCTVNVIGWTLALDEMDLQAGHFPIDTSLYTAHGEWDLVKTSVVSSEFNGGFDKIYRNLKYSLTFRRRWPYYGLTLICPLALSSLLMAGVFAVPVESGEKVGYSLTVLLSFTVLLTLISDSLPTISTKTSVLQVYLSTVMILGALTTFLTLVILWAYHRDEKKPLPRLALALHSVMALCVCRSKKKKLTTKVKPEDAVEPSSETFGDKTAEWRKGDNSVESPYERVTWQDFSRCLDAFCLRVFTFVFVIVFVVFLSYMYSIYYSTN